MCFYSVTWKHLGQWNLRGCYLDRSQTTSCQAVESLFLSKKEIHFCLYLLLLYEKKKTLF